MLIIIGRWLVLLIVNGTLVIVIDIVGNTFSVIVALLDVDCKCEDVINEPVLRMLKEIDSHLTQASNDIFWQCGCTWGGSMFISVGHLHVVVATIGL